MIAFMAKKKPRRGRPKSREDTFIIQARVDADLFAALTAIADKSRRSKNAELVIALEQYATAAGEWPRNKKGEGGQP